VLAARSHMATMKALGNAAFARGDFTSAVQLYRGGISAKEDDPASLYRYARVSARVHLAEAEIAQGFASA